MILPVILTSIATLASASASFAIEAKIGSTPIRLTPPQGQCEVSNEKGDEARMVGKLRELLAGKNQLLAVFADCGELAQFRSGKQDAFENYASYMAPTITLNVVAPTSALAKACAAMRAQTDHDLAAIFTNRKADIERSFPGTRINQARSLGVLSEEPSVCYSGQLTTFSGTEKMQASITATILLKGKIFNYHLYAVYRGNDTISDLLGKHKRNVAALIAANVDPRDEMKKRTTPITTIWRQTENGLQLVRTIPGLPYNTAPRIHIEGLGDARLSGTGKTGSGANEAIDEVKYTLE